MSAKAHEWSNFEDVFLLRCVNALPLIDIATRLGIPLDECASRLQLLQKPQPEQIAKEPSNEEPQLDALQSLFQDLCVRQNATSNALDAIAEILSRNASLEEVLQEAKKADPHHDHTYVITYLFDKYIFAPRPYTIREQTDHTDQTSANS